MYFPTEKEYLEWCERYGKLYGQPRPPLADPYYVRDMMDLDVTDPLTRGRECIAYVWVGVESYVCQFVDNNEWLTELLGLSAALHLWHMPEDWISCLSLPELAVVALCKLYPPRTIDPDGRVEQAVVALLVAAELTGQQD